MRSKLHNGKDYMYCRPVRATTRVAFQIAYRAQAVRPQYLVPELALILICQCATNELEKADTNTSIETPFVNEQCFIHNRIPLRPNRRSC